VTLYANASRTLTAEPATAQGAATGTTSARPRAIGLDPAWWEALGRTAGSITLAATGKDPQTGAPVALTCDVDLPAAP
jgi:hypothetical protein